ncbi:hypothetical protein ABW21_db0201710 [Orbilia brochopaga]|nr:hypothetical protein ABW21_db0201710 [Drechslerella brochopaga]
MLGAQHPLGAVLMRQTPDRDDGRSAALRQKWPSCMRFHSYLILPPSPPSMQLTRLNKRTSARRATQASRHLFSASCICILHCIDPHSSGLPLRIGRPCKQPSRLLFQSMLQAASLRDILHRCALSNEFTKVSFSCVRLLSMQ